MIWFWVAVGAALGAPARYLADRFVQTRLGSDFPWGTLLVNIVGSLALGVITGVADALAPALGAALGIGFCGALTTYSTFSYETFRLLESKAIFDAVANVTVALVGGFAAMALGLSVGGWLM